MHAIMTFPDWFPKPCPPETAVDAHGIVYRFAARKPIHPDDFRSHHELGLAPRATPCSRCSLSVYRTLNVARVKLLELRDRFPDRFGPHIAEGGLEARYGKLKQEGKEPDHQEWWAYEGIERHEPFRIVETLST